MEKKMITEKQIRAVKSLIEKLDLCLTDIFDYKEIGRRVGAEIDKAPPGVEVDWHRVQRWVEFHFNCLLDISLIQKLVEKYKDYEQEPDQDG